MESLKFVRQYPLNQRDIIQFSGVSQAGTTLAEAEARPAERAEVKFEKRAIDHTPPKYITLLFTDLGVLTPSAVSDELIKLYN